MKTTVTKVKNTIVIESDNYLQSFPIADIENVRAEKRDAWGKKQYAVCVWVKRWSVEILKFKTMGEAKEFATELIRIKS